MPSEDKSVRDIIRESARKNNWEYSTYSKIDSNVKKYFPFDNARKNQLETISEIKNAIDKGYKYIILEAGTGTGKSAIAATLAEMYDSTYILTVTKQLQEQYLNDFKDLGFKLVKGRGNFKCRKYGADNLDHTCAEGKCKLEGHSCEFKISKNYNNISKDTICEYDYQKFLGLISKVVISNYHYLYYELNYVKDFTKRKLMIFDEAHNLEEILMGQLKLEFNREDLKQDIGVNLSKETIKMLNNGDYNVWIQFIQKIRDKYKFEHDKLKDIKRIDVKQKVIYLKSRVDDCEEFVSHIKKDPDKWIFDYDPNVGIAEFKPVKVDKYAEDKFFRYGDVCIFMSATILDYKLFAKWLGIKEDEIYAIRQKSPFEINRNPLITFEGFDMSYTNLSKTAPKTLNSINEIFKRHENEKGIIHTISYECKDYLKNKIDSNRLIDHNTFNRSSQLKKFKKSTESLVLISPSMNEGVDLPGDLCRFQVIFKIPYPSLADKQTNVRMRMDSEWYRYKTSLTLVQTLGRGMRYEDDYCTTYFLDSRLLDFVFKDTVTYNFLPDSFKLAINAEPALIDRTQKFSSEVIFDEEDVDNYSDLSYLEKVDVKYELTMKGIDLLEKEEYCEAIEFYKELLTNELFCHDYHPFLKLAKAYLLSKQYDLEADIIEKFFKSGIYCRKSTVNWFKKKLKELADLGHYDFMKFKELESSYKRSGAKNRKLSKVPVPFAVDIKNSRKRINRNPVTLDSGIFDDLVKFDENQSYEDKINFKYYLIQTGEDLIDSRNYPKAAAFYSRLLSHELFANDYYPYRQLSYVYRKDRQRNQEVEILEKFFKSGIYCSEKQLKWFKNRLKQLSNYGYYDYSKISELEEKFNSGGALNQKSVNHPVPITSEIKYSLDYPSENVEVEFNPVEKSSTLYKQYSKQYFYDLAKEITEMPNYVSDRQLLAHNDDDFIYIGNSDIQLNKKADLKNKGKELENNDECEAIKFYEELKKDELFKYDYWPYRRQCILFKNKIKDNESDWKTINEVFRNEIYLNDHQYIWLYNKTSELIPKLNLEDEEINEMEKFLQNYIENHEKFKKPAIPIAERIFKEADEVKLLSQEKYDLLQNIFYRKELGSGYIRMGNYENAIQYYVELLDEDFLYFKYHAYKRLGRIFEIMNDYERFKTIYEKYKSD
jgi:Rad3-related DNA helicase